ncbi:Core trichothecene cluster (CTC) protein 14 [Colletotrichum shisoi]|uniref:Core trichothecene cluster (CTC) protein 14 n=1 Tax=Colletotrichum shisoi TaxID=2078593 RepID=A0A5Q4BCX1_9PEZI|nr:Core trichothecene cluster (CTC) protein 14 [Colletotrichum shisoi]
MISTLTLALSSLLALPVSLACPTKPHTNTTCRPVSGDKTIASFQLYPENADFDTKRCVAVLYNSTVAVWDPYTNSIVDTITVPGLSFNPKLHSSGVRRDPLDRLSIIIDAGAAFDTGGQDISGDNFLVKYDLASRQVLWQRNLTAVTGGVYSGFQDTAHAADGTTFALGTFPSSIIRVSADGKTAAAWYAQTPPDHTVHGLSGLVSSPDGKSLLVVDNADGQLYRFDISAAEGTPVRVPLTGAELIGTSLDGVSIPSRYQGTVILVTDNAAGTVVLRSRDASWDAAEVLGTVPASPLAEGGASVTTVQIGGSVYAVSEWFMDEKVAGTLAGNRTEWPLVDISAQIDALLI